MVGLAYLGGAADDDADATVSLTGVTANSTLLVAVKAAASTASSLGAGSVTDTFTDVSAWTLKTNPAAQHANGGGIDANAKAWCAWFTATAGSDTAGDITATVTNAGATRLDVWEYVGTNVVVTGDADESEAGDVGVPNTFTVPLVSATPTIDDVVLGALAFHEYASPSGIQQGNGCTLEVAGTVEWGTHPVTGAARVLRFLDQSRTQSTQASIEWAFTGGDEFAEAGAAVIISADATAATDLFPGVGLTIEAAFDDEPLAESHEWTELTCDGVSVSLFRGRRDELGSFEPGSATVTYVTTDRSLDPDNAAGPYFGFLREMTPLRISTTFDGDGYRLFTGFVQSWPQETVGGAADAATMSPLSVIDAFSVLGNLGTPASEYELRVRQDDPTVYYPLDDSVGGYTRDASPNDFAAMLPHGLEVFPVSEFGGDGGVVGDYNTLGLGDSEHQHPDAGEFDINTVECVLNLGANRYTYDGVGTDSYALPILVVGTGNQWWQLEITRVFTDIAGVQFDESTFLRVHWTDFTNDRTSSQIQLRGFNFLAPSAATAGELQRQAVLASRKATAAHQRALKFARDTKTAIDRRDGNLRAVALLQIASRASGKAAQEAAIAAREAASAARAAAQVVLSEGATRVDETDYPVHIAATESGGTVRVYVDGILKATVTSGSETGTQYPGFIHTELNPRGVAVGHVAAYESVLDAQVLLEHAVCSKVGLGQQRSGDRALMVLRSIGWPVSLTDIDRSKSRVVGSPGGPTLAYLQQLEEAERGRLFIGPNGKVTFRSRTWDLVADTATTSVATLTDDVTGDICYSEITVEAASQDTIANDVSASREGGQLQRRYVPARDRRVTFSRNLSGLLVHNDQAAGNIAAGHLRRYKDPQTRITSLTIYPLHPQTGDTATVWPFILGAEVGQRVTVRRTPQNVGSAFVQECTIEGIEHAFEARSNWRTTLYLVPAQDPATDHKWFVVGDATLGQIGDADANHILF